MLAPVSPAGVRHMWDFAGKEGKGKTCALVMRSKENEMDME
jgi:hypothetical protein